MDNAIIETFVVTKRFSDNSNNKHEAPVLERT